MKSPDDRLWTLEDVAHYLQVKVSTVKYWMYTDGLPHVRLGKHPRFDPEDVKEWVESKKCNPPERRRRLRHIE